VTFDRFDVVKVPFPFTDKPAKKVRPALVISDAVAFNADAGHSVMAMITSAGHATWPLDVPIDDLPAAGLPVASLVRMKLFTLDHRLVIGTIGKLTQDDAQLVTNALTRLFR